MSYHDSYSAPRPKRDNTHAAKDRRLSQLEDTLQEIADTTTDERLKEKIKAVLKEQS